MATERPLAIDNSAADRTRTTYTPSARSLSPPFPRRTRDANSISADVNGGNRGGNSALHSAAFFSHVAIVQLLLDHGASPEAKDDDGRTPADLVAGPWNRYVEDNYTGIAGFLGLPIDIERIKRNRPHIAKILQGVSRRF